LSIADTTYQAAALGKSTHQRPLFFRFLITEVGCDGQTSGNVNVPIGYAGSISSSAIISGARLSGTFPAAKVRNEEVTYFYREPTQKPELSGFALLLAETIETNDKTPFEQKAMPLGDFFLFTEEMYKLFTLNTGEKDSVKTICRPTSLRVKVGDIEVDVTFSHTDDTK
jgi:hypothetical protein